MLAVIRYFARGYFDSFLSFEQTGALFYLLAFGMILRWRAQLYFAYRALNNNRIPAFDTAIEEALKHRSAFRSRVPHSLSASLASHSQSLNPNGPP